MKHLREDHLYPNDEMPDVAEEGDIVRVYESPESQYYIIGKVISFDDRDESQEYTVDYYNKGGEPDKIKVKYDRVEVETTSRKVNVRTELTEYQKALLSSISHIEDPEILNLLADGAQTRVKRYDENISRDSHIRARLFQREIENLFSKANRESK